MLLRTSSYTINNCKLKNVSCESEGFVETHICNCEGYFDRAYYGDLIKNVSPYLGGGESDNGGIQWVYKYVAVNKYATLFTFGGRIFINNSIRGKN